MAFYPHYPASSQNLFEMGKGLVLGMGTLYVMIALFLVDTLMICRVKKS